MLQGDRFFTLLRVRVLSYGPDYAFAVPCENRGCRARIEWELDLRELPVRTLSDESPGASSVAFVPLACSRIPRESFTGSLMGPGRRPLQASFMPVAAPIPFLGADVPRADGYARRRPEESLLYHVVAEHWPEFRQRAEEAGGLPRFVVREFEQYLPCGILEHGLARLRCHRCGHEMVLAWPCKRRGFCPSCCGRRMSDLAAHLVDAVLPAGPVV